MAPVLTLLKVVLEAILEVFLLCLAGYILARRGILDKKTQKQINRLNVSLFTPALLFSKVAFSLSPGKLRELWIIPIFFVFVTGVSMAVAYVLGWIFRLKRSQRNFAIASSMFMNSNSLPIALMQSLVVTVPNLKWDDDDSKTAMIGRALSYLVLYSTLGMVLRWSYGVHLLSQADPEGQELSNERSYDPESQPLLSDHDDSCPTIETVDDNTPSVILTNHDENVSGSLVETQVESLHPHSSQPQNRVFYSFPNTPQRSAVNLATGEANGNTPSKTFTLNHDIESDSESDSEETLTVNLNHHARNTPEPSRLRGFFKTLGGKIMTFLHAFNEFMTVPLWAALFSLIVALIPPVQHTLDVHVHPFKGALRAAGDCSIPLTLVVLGAYFVSASTTVSEAGPNPLSGENGVVNGSEIEHNSVSRSTSFVGSVRSMLRLSRLDRSRSRGRREEDPPRPGESRTVFIAVASRMFVTPLLILPLMAIGARYDYPKVFDDPVFVVSNVLLVSSPPALTLAQITQAASGDAFERLISRTIFWSYCIITPPATIIYVVIGLLLAKL